MHRSINYWFSLEYLIALEQSTNLIGTIIWFKRERKEETVNTRVYETILEGATGKEEANAIYEHEQYALHE